MNTTQGSMLVSLKSVQTFIDDNAAALGGVVNTGARTKLTQAIADLARHASDQKGSVMESQSATRGKESLRLALMRDHMAPIARIAKSELPLTPELTPLRMPRGRPTIPKLAAYADGMAKAASQYSQVFIDNGEPADFIARLNVAADTLLSSVSDHANIRGKRTIATKSLKAKLSAGRRIVHILDAYVKSALKDDPNLLSGWNAVKRVSLRGTRPSAAVPPALPATQSVPQLTSGPTLFTD